MIEAVLFGGGCFWITEPAFAALDGVTESQAGYSGGHTYYPRYEQVRLQRTGHVQVAQVRYDSDMLSFQQLLDAFFSIHDPTLLNRQDPDIGSEYASVIFYTTRKQKLEAQDYIAKLERKLATPIVTRLEAAQVFWPAEPEHYDYYLRNFLEPYSTAVIQPKLRQFSVRFKDHLPSLKRHRRQF